MQHIHKILHPFLSLLMPGFYLLVLISLGTGEARAASRLTGLQLSAQQDKTQIIIELTDKLPFSLFSLADPYRIVIDLPELQWAASARSAGSATGLVSGYRFGLFQPGNSRFVLDLQQPARVTQAYYATASGKSERLVLELIRTGRDGFLASAGFQGRSKPSTRLDLGGSDKAAKSAPLPPQMGAVTPIPNPRRVLFPPPAAFAPLDKPEQISPPVLHTIPIPKASPRRRIQTVVIDAGHGGVDPGAITASGVYEKDIVLDVARRLQRLLERERRYNVVMTRDSDVFVQLRDRVDNARNVKADLFVSIHADMLESPNIRGASVYTLSEQASDDEAAALAAKENNADMIAGVSFDTETDELVKTILIDLAQRETTNKSVHFAKLLLPELNNAGKLLKNSHRFAGFRVLKAPDVPSVLVELGLLSNKIDVKNLTSSSGRERLALALKNAIDAYFRQNET